MILKKEIFLKTKWSELISKCAISVSLSDQYIYFLLNPNIKLSDDFKNEIWVFDWIHIEESSIQIEKNED